LAESDVNDSGFHLFYCPLKAAEAKKDEEYFFKEIVQ